MTDQERKELKAYIYNLELELATSRARIARLEQDARDRSEWKLNGTH
jgi:hypothetical protein